VGAIGATGAVLVCDAVLGDAVVGVVGVSSMGDAALGGMTSAAGGAMGGMTGAAGGTMGATGGMIGGGTTGTVLGAGGMGGMVDDGGGEPPPPLGRLACLFIRFPIVWYGATLFLM